MERFAEKLRTLRKKHGLTQQQVADELGISTQTFVHRLETGQKKPSVEHVLKLAQIFGVTPDQLLLDDREIEEGSD
jgi:transcriptional regulator with XRE-family HTH domain